MKRDRKAKILATLGPASASDEMIRALFVEGADVFRLNFSHGTHSDHARRYESIRKIEAELNRPIGILLDLQGPKLRVGTFAAGKVQLTAGASFRLDLDPTPGDASRAPLLHPEIFAALEAGTELLIDDGKVRLRVDACGPDFAQTTVLVPGPVSDRKGVNVPGVVLPISPLTEKDRKDLAFGLELGVDWVALSFVQRPEDLIEARKLVGDKAWIMAKLEKPSAIEQLEEIIELADGVMVARGDLGVELPPEQLPQIQRRIVRIARRLGKPVVVATQMLESMIESPVPTRAEASDVATAIYDGVDAVMLSAESASGKFPLEAVSMMNRIVCQVEKDPAYRVGIDATHTPAQTTTQDAVCYALRGVAEVIQPAATITYTESGFTALRAARERPTTPILSLTPHFSSARRLAMVWGIHAIPFGQVSGIADMVMLATQVARRETFAQPGENVVIVAGLPFGRTGSTNLLHVARVDDVTL
ncbi:MAG: pyruvate kinase [Rhodocyclales bacterium GT-UBC]|nr:MAG: pyruvate kinase [Rhodocyclales bacterium GT-UBC]